MSLTQSQLQIRTNVRRMANVEGTTALVRHPDADLNDYINRAYGSLYRILNSVSGDQRFLSTTTITTAAATSAYALPATFDSLLTIDLVANGSRVWLVPYELHEHASLTDASSNYSGVPFTYRLRGANIDLLPTPAGIYTVTIWYTPSFTQLTADGDTIDTISRLDDYIIAYAARWVAIRDKNWDLVSQCKALIDEFRSEVELAARTRDKNAPPRVIDESYTNRWGRRAVLPRRWR